MTALAAQITLHRNLYRDELESVGKTTQRTPPVAFTYDESERSMVPDNRPLVYFTDDGMVEVPDSATQSTQVGMPWSGRMYRYVTGPSPETPWATSWKALRSWCRKNHRYHMTPPHWRGALCWELVNLVIVQDMSVYNAAQITQYDDPEPLLTSAFEYMEKQIDKLREKQEYRAKEDAGLGPGAVPDPEPPRFHLAFHEFHVADCHRCHTLEERPVHSCPQCRRRNAA